MLDRLRIHATLVRHALDVDLSDGTGIAAIGHPLVDEHLEDREREKPLRARRVSHPLVGIGRRERLARLDVDDRSRAALAEGVHPREGGRVMDVVDPRLQKVGAEVQDHLRLGEQVGRHGVAAERRAIGGPDGFVAERLQRHARTGAERLPEAVQQCAEATVFELTDDGDRTTLVGATEGRELFNERLQRVVPAEWPQPGPVAALRSGKALWPAPPIT